MVTARWWKWGGKELWVWERFGDPIMTDANETWYAKMTNKSFEGYIICFNFSLWLNLEQHPRKYCVLYVNEIKKCLHHSCHLVDDRHGLEDDDQQLEDCYQLIQPEPWSAGHATGFPVLDVCWSIVPVMAWSEGCSLSCCSWPSDFKIGSYDGSELESSSNWFLFHVTKNCQCLWKVDSWSSWRCSVS